MAVDNQWCTGCVRCIRGCPEKAITFDMFAHVAAIDRLKCNVCGVCEKF